MKTKPQIVFIAIFIALVACGVEVNEPQVKFTATTVATTVSTAISTAIPTQVSVATLAPTSAPTLTATVPSPVVVQVLSDGSGDYATLATAVASVSAGSTIILDEGIFHLEESLNIDKPLTLQGAGKYKTTVMGEGPTVVVRYSGEGLLKIQGMTFRRVGNFSAIVMAVIGGEVDFSDCRFTNGATYEDESVSGIGLVFANDATGTVQNCEVDQNHSFGILVGGQAKLELRGNNIHDNGRSGIYFLIDEDGGLVELNDLEGNDLVGFGRGRDITVIGRFAPVLSSNTCSYESVGYNSSDRGDQSGIVFVSSSDTDLPAASTISGNNCAIAWCSGSPLDMGCSAQR